MELKLPLRIPVDRVVSFLSRHFVLGLMFFVRVVLFWLQNHFVFLVLDQAASRARR